MCLSGMGAVTGAAFRMERARGSRAELPQRPRYFPIERGPTGRDKAGCLFRSGDIREPALTSAKVLSSAPQGGPFSSASRRAAVSTNPVKTGFLHICEARGNTDSVSEGSNGPRSPTMLCTGTRIARPKRSTSSALSPRRFPLVGTDRRQP